MKTILYLTDLYYKANGRKYYEEDLFITDRLRAHFNILIGHPQQAIRFLEHSDLVVFRNTGPVIGYQEYFQKFLEAVKDHEVKTFNSFDGKADIKGKQYLIDLTKNGFPVIPTINSAEAIDQLGHCDKYVLKLKNGADSIGMKILNKKDLLKSDLENKLIQPFIDFKYEVSFYYLNDEFQYALYAPDKAKRWELTEYEASEQDLDFAEKFISWNGIQQGITRVDACRQPDGSLLLVELEDLNPFLSIDLLNAEKREEFINALIHSLKKII
ncbi:hypothetical protein [Christiangramia salexigens]|uniref:ATP-grasp domain-containing protein n=1 Tax=Christiangramia salexigens TaxID=1913577 RepID=A0A1L3J8E5_9FLAO|nr:hypothetical protein [Christiangramia salexigens]APG61383.1 hypothetical protein LPB144_05320 [Christiangramia salexigens]